MALLINEVLFFIFIVIFLIIFRKIILGEDFFTPINKRYISFNRNLQIGRYIKEVSKKKEDPQKILSKEILIFSIFSLIIFILASKAIFFTAVASDSMRTTFEKNDLVLLQNFEHSYAPGDIVMFIEPFTSRPTTHRIVSIENDIIRTAGDFTGVVDVWKINKNDIIGKAVMIQGKPVMIKRYGRFFIVDKKNQDLALFGNDYRAYFLFFQVIKIYGYVIVVICVILYIAITFKKKSWQNR